MIEIEALINEMTLEEKIALCHGGEIFKVLGVPRLRIPPLVMSDGPLGVRREYEGNTWEALDYSDDYSTYLPCNMALASTWNRKLAYESGDILGEEARGRGKDVILAPGINIARSPLCGRNFEYMGEDPYLAGELAVPFIQGVQEHDVAACVKHFVANNQETKRLEVSVEVDERALREIYMPAFEKAIRQGQAKTIMAAYNRLRGEQCAENSYLLQEVLREEWGFEGVVISDWGAVVHTYEAAMNGLDIEMDVSTHFEGYKFATPLLEAVEKEVIPEEVIDEKVRHILKLMDSLKMFEPSKRKKGFCNKPSNRLRTLETARESIVLLKNEKGALPLREDQISKVILIGENGAYLHAGEGDSAQVKALYEISPLMGLKMRLGGNIPIQYVQGYSTKHQNQNKMLYEEVLQTLKDSDPSDTIIYVGGLTHDLDEEGVDKPDMLLPADQDQLIQAILDERPDAILVMLSGSPYDMQRWVHQAHTLVQTWYNGMEGGYALAEVLMGDVNPSGKLPMTFPICLEDCPAHMIGEFPGGDEVNYTEGIFVGYRYFNSKRVPVQFPFGYGLSYTEFDYSHLACSKEADQVRVTFEIENIGSKAGAETAQIYVERQEGAEDVVYRQLQGFEKIYLEAGEKKKVEVILEPRAFQSYDRLKKTWIRDCDKVQIVVGRSVEQVELRQEIKLA